MAKELLCSLNTNHKCISRTYERICELQDDRLYATCPYQILAVELKEEDKESEPAPVVI